MMLQTIGIALGVAIALAACGGGGGESAAGGGGSTRNPPPATSDAERFYAVKVNATGLSGSGLTLQNNAGDDLSVSANGTTSFSIPLTSGSSFAVTISSQPTSPVQLCTLNNANGTISSSDAEVSVSCEVTPTPTPTPIGETPPTNSAPEAGSTTAVGAGAEGLWMAAPSSEAGIAFIDAAGNYFGTQNTHSLLTGRWTVSGSGWSFDSGSRILLTGGGIPISTGLAGNGTLNPDVSFSGVYGVYTSPSSAPPATNFAHDYSAANALAVSQSDIAGTWSAAGLTLSIDTVGAITGQVVNAELGTCLLNGTAVLASPGTSKNLYSVSLTATSGSTGTCNVDPTWVHEGKAAITFTDVSNTSAPLYSRSLTLLVAKNASWIVGQLLRS